MKTAAFTPLVLLLASAGVNSPLCLHGEELPKLDVNVVALLESIESGEQATKLDALGRLKRVAIDQQFGDQQGAAIKQCVQLLQSADGELAEAACEVLSWLDAVAAPPLVAVLASDDPDAQARAARAISAIASRGRAKPDKLDFAIEPLAELLDGDSKTARHNAVYAISALGSQAIPTMIDTLDAEDYFITVMTEGFVRHGGQSVEPLCEALQSGDLTVRRNAALVLFAISWRVPDALPVLESKGLAQLTTAIDDEDQLVCARAVATLGRMKGRAKPSLDEIVAALARPDAPFYSIADAVALIGPEVKHLDALFDAAARAAGAKDMNNRVRNAGEFGAAIGAVGEDGVERVISALDDRREAVRETAMMALLHLGPQAAPAVPAVIRKLNEKDRWAAHVLGTIGPPAKEAVPHLIRRLADDEWAKPRSATALPHHSDAAHALAAIGSPALPSLLAGLKHDDDLVKAGCLVALEFMDPKSMVPTTAIEPLTRHENSTIRGHALLALLKHGDANDHLPLLKQLAKDPHPGIARIAQEQLKVRSAPIHPNPCS